MSLPVGIYNLCLPDLAIFHIIEFKLLRVSEMLKNLSVFISYSNFYVSFSSFLCTWLVVPYCFTPISVIYR